MEVYRTGKVTQAAENLNMTQPAATRAIKDLEEEFGTVLFERINKRLMVTEAGRLFYDYASHILDSYDKLEKKMTAWDYQGMIKVGATNTLGNFLLPEVLKDYKEEFPEVEVYAKVAKGSELYAGLESNDLDFGIVEGRIRKEGYVYEEIGSDRLVYVMNRTNPLALKETIALEDLKGQKFLVREKGSVGRFLLDAVCVEHGLELDIVMESESTQALIEGAALDLGITLLPIGFLDRWKNDWRLVFRDAEGDLFRRHSAIVWHRNKHLSTASRNFMEILKEHARSYFAKLE